MNGEYKELVKKAILEEENLTRATLSGSLPGQTVPWIRVVIRPVLVRGERVLQFSHFDGKKDIAKNYSGEEAGERLDELLALPFRNFHVETGTRTVQVNLTKKGRPIVHEGRVAEQEKKHVNLSHDREKDLILPADKAEPFLQAVGIMTREG